MDLELTVLMPCLNEAETLERCIQKALYSINELGLKAEVLIADNGSTDASVEIAQRLGARVAHVHERGYGNALRGGIVMGDADDSYDFSKLGPFVEKIRQGYDLVMGCRMPRGGGTIMPGAMPWKHRWLGNPVLSLIGRVFFRCPVADFHCGLRAFTKAAYYQMDLQTTGMEFASEMVIKATLKGLRIGEVPITLHKDGRSRPPHLRSWRDGWRHLRFMLLFSPRWLFLYPGLGLMAAGILASLWLLPGPRKAGTVTLDVHTLLYTIFTILLGFQAVLFGVFTKVFAISAGLLPPDPRMDRLFRVITLEVGLLIGSLLLIIGGVGSMYALRTWSAHSFGPMSPTHILRIILPSVLALMLGAQVIFASFFLSILGLKKR
jgi:hypothetical protein